MGQLRQRTNQLLETVLRRRLKNGIHSSSGIEGKSSGRLRLMQRPSSHINKAESTTVTVWQMESMICDLESRMNLALESDQGQTETCNTIMKESLNGLLQS